MKTTNYQNRLQTSTQCFLCIDYPNLNFFYNGSILAGQKCGNNTLTFMYDNNGDTFGFTYNSAEYYYIKNAQNDVIGIVDNTGTVVVKYIYDAWGKVLSITGSKASTIGVINPLRYRSYVYDEETGLYYLNSRYYDSVVGRFINADSVISGTGESVQGYNLFSYCFNNPVNMMDEDGMWPTWVTKVLIGAAVIAAAAVVTVVTGGAGAGVAGFIAAGVFKGAVIGAFVGAATGAAGGAISHRVSSGSWKGAGGAALNGGANGFMTGAITGAISGVVGKGAQVAKASKSWNKGTFKSPVKSMNHHYKNKVVGQGYAKGNNVVKYTNDATNFAKNNSSYFRYQYSSNYGHSRWTYSNSYGGGFYSGNGNIYTFWYKG